MPIDRNAVKWDDDAPDANAVQWDDAPALPSARVVNHGDARAKYWQALRVGDAAGAYAAQKSLRDQGIDVSNEPEPSVADEATRNTVRDMSGGQRFAAGAGASLANTGRGLQQLAQLAHGGLVSNSLPGMAYAQSQRDQAAAQRVDSPLNETGAGISGNALGTVGQIVAPGAGAIRYSALAPEALGALRAASLPGTVRGAGLQGMAIGGLQPTAPGDSRPANIGLSGLAGLLGAGGPRVINRTAQAVGRPLSQLSERGVERRVAEVLRSESTNPAALLRPQPSSIPGVRRTLAEESLDPGIARLERNARSTGQGFDAIGRANNAAHIGALERFAGDDASIVAAKAARSQASNSARREAMQVSGVDTNRLLSQIKRLETMQNGRPAVQSGLAQVRGLLTREVPEAERKKLALAPLEAFIASGRKSTADFEAAKAAMTAIRRGEKPTGAITSQSGQDALKESQKAFGRQTMGHDKVAVLDNVRKTIGDMLGGKFGGESAAALAGSRELMAVKAQLDRVLEKQAPRYGEYLDAYRTGSVPINRMQLGQDLMGAKSGSAILDPVTGKQVLTPAAFSRNARNLDGLAAQATGFRKAKAANMLRPEDMRTIAGVQDDLERRNFAATAGSGGNSQTFERMAAQDRIGSNMLTKVPVLGAAVGELNRMGQRRLEAKLAEVLANPAMARSILGNVPAHDRQIILMAISRSGGLAGGVAPTLQK